MASDDLEILLHRLRNALAAVEVSRNLQDRAARPHDADLADTLVASADELADVADQIAEAVRRVTSEHV